MGRFAARRQGSRGFCVQNPSSNCGYATPTPSGSSCSQLSGMRGPSAVSTNTLATADTVDLEQLEGALDDLSITQNQDGSTTLRFTAEANSYQISYATANSFSNGGAPVAIVSTDRCGNRTVSKSSKMEGRYEMETTVGSDGKVAFTLTLDADITRAGLLVGNQRFVIDPAKLRLGQQTRQQTHAYEQDPPATAIEPQAPSAAPPYPSAPTPAEQYFPPAIDTAPRTTPETTPTVAQTTAPMSTVVEPTTSVPPTSAVPESTIPAAPPAQDISSSPTAEMSQPLALEPLIIDTQPLLPDTLLPAAPTGPTALPDTSLPAPPTSTDASPEAPPQTPEVTINTSNVTAAFNRNFNENGGYPFTVTHNGRQIIDDSFNPSYGGLSAYMHIDSSGLGKVHSLWSARQYRNSSGTWIPFPLEGFDPGRTIHTSLSTLPSTRPPMEHAQPSIFRSGQAEGYAFPRWTANGDRGVVVLQMTDQLPPGVAHVYKEAMRMGQRQGLTGPATLTPIPLPASDPKFENNVHGWLAPDGRVLFTYAHDSSYRIYDPLEHMNHVRERRYQRGQENGRWATLKSTWDRDDGYKPPRLPQLENFDPRETLRAQWGR